MDYELSDSSGTDDDLPPHQNRFSRGGRAATNGRPANVGPGSFSRVQSEMETQIHHIEQEAYCSVLRAFKAQSDAISWEKEALITDLRKELRVSDEEHRELLSRVNADDMIRRIREWRMASGFQSGAHANIDALPSPSMSALLKRQKSSLSVAPFPSGGPSPALHPSMQPSSSAMKRGSTSAGRGKKHEPFATTGLIGRTQAANRGYGVLASNEPAEGATQDPYIGRKVWTRWPEDNHFYEALITEYDPLQGRHALVYDMYSADETWEWVNLKEISPEDIRWESEEPGVSRKGVGPGSGRGAKKPMTRGGGVNNSAGRGRGNSKVPSKSDFPQVQNGIGKKAPGDIELLHTETLIKEVEKIFNASQPDPIEIQKAKRVLKEHEHALVDAIAMLEDTSDGESDGKHNFSKGQAMEQD
ncbi:unnamed protein product [Rhodiola kirilowii]